MPSDARAPIEGLLFDIDGVLVDSEPFLLEACKLFFRRRGVEVGMADFLPFVGRGENRYIGGVAERRGVPIEIESAKREVYALYDEIASGRIATPLGRMRPMAGVREFIGEAKGAGLKVALASSADLAKVLINLKAAGYEMGDFDFVVSGSAVERKKPYPDIYLLAASKIQVAPGRCLVFDDAESGCAAGAAAGCRCVGVLGSFSKEALLSSGAQAVVRDFLDLRGFKTASGLALLVDGLIKDQTMAPSSKLEAGAQPTKG